MPHEVPTNHNCFELTEHEKLFDHVSHARFMALVASQEVVIHSVEETGNAFGEFLFVTLGCRTPSPDRLLTFYGLGYHEQRERWITDDWRWYESQRDKIRLETIDKREAMTRILAREAYARTGAAASSAPSRHARLYALLADLTDEDGALTEMEEEMEDLGWAFLGGLDDTRAH